MATERDKPKRGASRKRNPKGDKRKSDKGKAKGKHGDAGKGKPQVKQVGEAEANTTEGREWRQQSCDPKQPEIEPSKHLEEKGGKDMDLNSVFTMVFMAKGNSQNNAELQRKAQRNEG